MAKKSISRHGKKSDGYNYFQNLPNELVICIFTKLSSSNNDEHDSRDDLKALGPCLCVSKWPCLSRSYFPFHKLLSLHGHVIQVLTQHPQEIKYIRSLKITRWSIIELQLAQLDKCPPIILWEAAYRPHNYSLVVVSYKKSSTYIDRDPDPQSLMLLDSTPKDGEYYSSVWSHIENMIRLHHMLVSSTNNHRHLQRVVVTNLYHRGLWFLRMACYWRLEIVPIPTSNMSSCVIGLVLPLIEYPIPGGSNRDYAKRSML